MKYSKFLLLGLTMLSFSLVAPRVLAATETAEATQAVLAEASDVVEILDIDQELVGLDVATVEEMPSTLGLWWRRVRERVALSITFDPVKKAEKRLRFAEENMRLADFIATNSTDPDQQAQALRLSERAEEHFAQIAKVQAELLANPEARQQLFLQNMARFSVNYERIMDNLESKLPGFDAANVETVRARHAERVEAFLDKVENNPNLPEEVKNMILEKKTIIESRQAAREAWREANKELLEKARAGDEAAKEQLRQAQQERLEEQGQAIQERQETRQRLIEEIKSGDQEAVQELKQLNLQDRNRVRAIIKNSRPLEGGPIRRETEIESTVQGEASGRVEASITVEQEEETEDEVDDSEVEDSANDDC